MNIQINEQFQLNKALENGLIELYQDIFSEAPYFEKFSEEHVKSIFCNYFNNGSLFLKYSNEK
ncbi:hypothetical protein FJR38_26425 [Anabaena sp. UHCC 0253]|uniref:hypothetical protein n=1 Tax=Anabaena sp. UHCC 0253 TaxID=2590019 RepID=UPI001446B393|nr:hypothetical protein [Anabaena sp. UHCC 0253]MTJ55942.1 hypothetical protein [Anabaena sp. UHCC 0253]